MLVYTRMDSSSRSAAYAAPFAVSSGILHVLRFLVHSQDLGPEDCTANVSLSSASTTVEIPPGTVCVECIINGEVVDDAQFQLQGSNIDPSNGRTVDGVLVLFQTENVFATDTSCTLRCSNSSGSTQALVVFVSKSYKLFCVHLK